MTPGLAALVHPVLPATFLTHLAANEPFVVHGLGPTIAPLTELPALASLDALLNVWPRTVKVHLPDVADEASAIDATPADARKLFDNGLCLLFDDAQSLAPHLVDWLHALRADLGLSALTVGRSLVYATPAGKGTAPHFDQNLNFVLQIHGRKTWRLAPNTHVEHPLTRHTMGLAPDAELGTYLDGPLPSAMPEDARTIVLEAGSMLFVPRGVWHATEAVTDALSLNFTYTPPTWLDLFGAALRGRLARSPEWRETALPASPERFEALLQALAGEAREWNAADILEITEG